MNAGGIVTSVLLHVGLFVVMTSAEAPPPPPQKTAIRIVEQKPQPVEQAPEPAPAIEAPQPEPKPEPLPPPPTPKPEPPKPKPKAKPAPEPTNDAPAPSNAPPLDLGNMTFTNEGGSGPAISPDSVGRDPEQPKPKPRPAEKRNDTPKPKPAAEACTEELVKPKALTKVPIDYPAAAREQGLEGQLVLRARIGADGSVLAVEVVKSIGPLIDEPAIAALKSWTFQPATKCGKPTEATFTIARRFELGT